MPANPWLKFYPADWRSDPSLRMCSLAARGLWVEMLCLMHEGYPRGYLRIKDKPVSDAQLANLAGVADAGPLLSELEAAGVFSRGDDGEIYSRRMIREDERAEKARVYGRLGGNPSLKGRVKGKDKPYSNSFSVKDSESKIKSVGPDERFDAFWKLYPNKVGKPAAVKAFAAALKRVEVEVIMDGLKRYIADKPEDRPWLNPSTFLNQDRFSDQPAKPGEKGEVVEPVIVLRNDDPRWVDACDMEESETGRRPKGIRDETGRLSHAFKLSVVRAAEARMA